MMEMGRGGSELGRLSSRGGLDLAEVRGTEVPMCSGLITVQVIKDKDWR